MGLINFVKSAGRLLGLGNKPDAVQDAAGKAPDAPAADAIKAELTRLGFPVGDVNVSVDGDKVKLDGKVPDQATREKIILASGNIAGIAGVEESLQAAAAEPEATWHTVVRGDTLSAIAKRHYGNANKYMAIFEANKPMLKDPDKIYPGQVLRIPPQG